MSPFFVVLAVTNVLVLFLLVRLPVRTHWGVKVALIVAMSALTFVAWGSRNSGRGWPLAADFPADSEFVTCVVVEPTTIYVWVIPLESDGGVLSYRSDVGEPRAYKEPYDRSLHVACEQAKKQAAQGVRTGIRRVHVGPNSHGRFMPYVLPSVHLPRKEGS